MDFSLLGFSHLSAFFNIHPMFVHFPVALYPSALLLYFLGVILKKRSLNIAGRSCLYLALASTVFALITGLIAEDSFPHNEVIHHLMQTHETLGWTILSVGTMLSVWSFWHLDQIPKGKWVFLSVLVFVTTLILQTADIGARMVYIYGAAVKPAVSVISEEGMEGHHHHHHEEEGQEGAME